MMECSVDMAEIETWREIGGLETNCSGSEFLSGVDVWVKRPQVVNKRLLGAVTVRESEVHERGESDASLRTQPRGVVANHMLIRELLPRAKVTAARREYVSTRHDGAYISVTFDPMRGDVIARGRGSYMLQHYSGRITLSTFASLREEVGAGREDGKGSSTPRKASGVSCGLELDGMTVPMPDCRPGCGPDGVTVPMPDCRPECGPDGVTVPMPDCRPECGPDGVTVPMLDCGSECGPDRVTVPMPDCGLECGPDGVTVPTPEWLCSVLLPKVVQWSEESRERERGARQQSLVPLDKYCSRYKQLKEKYGPSLIKNWPEATDPCKFVYEDIAIATYLILLWEEERKELALTEKQTFIDLGCGNGLLVYLLTSEGYTGKGIDLRRRKIWSYYGNRVDLEVCSLTPSDVTVFPEYDWLIGNHSDELTPWIPLMAARSSYHTRYFVLPCCPHDFELKFKRPDTTKSQYRSYLAYVRLIGETVGFKVQEDTLRIPSSKRVCQIGCKRLYSIEQEEEMEEKRRSFLRERCCNGRHGRGRGEGVVSGGQDVVVGEKESSLEMKFVGKSPGWKTAQVGTQGSLVGSVGEVEGSSEQQCRPREARDEDGVSPHRESGSSAWSDCFLPRSATVQTRNCAHVDRHLQQLIVAKLSSVLLATENWIEVPDSDHTSTKRAHTPQTSAKTANTPQTLASTAHTPHTSTETAHTPATPNSTTANSVVPCSVDRDCSPSCAKQCSASTTGERGGNKGLERFPLSVAATPGNGDASCSKSEGSPIQKLWNLGGRMKLSEAVQLFDSNVLKKLKQECGGLQTLLRNHHQVFRVCGGFVQLRNWTDLSQHGPRKPAKQRSAGDAKRLVKTKLCWFHSCHPQGCPRSQQACPYAHGSSELKDRPDFRTEVAVFDGFFAEVSV